MKSILVIDDDEIVLEEICAHLAGYQTYSAISGKIGLELARQFNPDLILLDIIMPGMDGFDVLDQLQQHPQLGKIPVIFLTADENPELQIRGFTSGAADFILKPSDRIILHSRIELHLQMAAYRLTLEQSVKELEDNISLAFADLIECKDYNFSGHVMRTGKYAELLALALYDEGSYAPELSLGFVEMLARAAPLHDIGKIGITDEILCKQGRLSYDEFKTVRTHTVIGARILSGIHEKIPGRAYFRMAELVARGHHERYDGKGYPSGFSGEDIPLCCRIVSVVNVYDACVTDRIYRAAMDHREACEEIQRGKGAEFDPGIVDVFLRNSDRFALLNNELRYAGGGFL